MPEELELLTLQGGIFVFNGGETSFSHCDSGVLQRTPVSALLENALR